MSFRNLSVYDGSKEVGNIRGHYSRNAKQAHHFIQSIIFYERATDFPRLRGHNIYLLLGSWQHLS